MNNSWQKISHHSIQNDCSDLAVLIMPGAQHKVLQHTLEVSLLAVRILCL